MLRRLLICLMLLGSPLTAAAQTVQDQIVTQLVNQGFEQMQVSRTLLGRVRILAVRGDLERELVFNPQTGEILRDLWVNVTQDGARSTAPRIFDPADDDDDDRRSNSAPRDRDDDDDRDNDAADDDDSDDDDGGDDDDDDDDDDGDDGDDD